MRSRSGIDRSFRRLRPAKRRAGLKRRATSELPYLREESYGDAGPFPPLLLDTTVYVDSLRGDIPPETVRFMSRCLVWHSTVTEGELATLTGLLDPSHKDTELIVRQVAASIDRRHPHRILNPDREVWREAGILAGLLARLQKYGKADQRKTLNDALIFLSAAKAGLTVLTRNVADFDLLMQLAPFGSAVFYEVAARPVKSK